MCSLYSLSFIFSSFYLISYCVSGRGNRISPVCVCVCLLVSAFMTEPFDVGTWKYMCVSLPITTKGLLGKWTVHWGTWKFRERSGVFILFYFFLSGTGVGVTSIFSLLSLETIFKRTLEPTPPLPRIFFSFTFLLLFLWRLPWHCFRTVLKSSTEIYGIKMSDYITASMGICSLSVI